MSQLRNKLRRLRLRKIGKQLFVGLLSTWAVLTLSTLSACATGGQIPDPPKGALCSIFAPENKLLCADAETGATLPTLTVAQADKYYCESPEMWKNTENYIDQLIALIKQAGSINPSVAGGPGVYLRATDVEDVKTQMWFLRKTMEQRRKLGK